MTFIVDSAMSRSKPWAPYEPSRFAGASEIRSFAPARPTTISGHSGARAAEREARVQAGRRYRALSEVERTELVANLVGALSRCRPDVQARMVSRFTAADPDYGRRVAEGLSAARW